jgi:hypothetical protein
LGSHANGINQAMSETLDLVFKKTNKMVSGHCMRPACIPTGLRMQKTFAVGWEIATGSTAVGYRTSLPQLHFQMSTSFC